MPEGTNIYSIAKISFLKNEGIKEKNSYERRIYESVDDESLYIFSYISKFDGKNVSGTNGLICMSH